MNMQESDFRRALEIITRNNRITVSFNTPIADNYYPRLSASYPRAMLQVLKQLHEAGLLDEHDEKGLKVSKY